MNHSETAASAYGSDLRSRNVLRALAVDRAGVYYPASTRLQRKVLEGYDEADADLAAEMS